MMQNFCKSQRGCNVLKLEEQIGLCTRFVSCLIKFLVRFPRVVLSYGPLRKSTDKRGGCVAICNWNHTGDDIGPPCRDIALRNLCEAICHGIDQFPIPEAEPDIVDGEKARRIIIRRNNDRSKMTSPIQDSSDQHENNDKCCEDEDEDGTDPETSYDDLGGYEAFLDSLMGMQATMGVTGLGVS